jgi:hypothetical protein
MVYELQGLQQSPRSPPTKIILAYSVHLKFQLGELSFQQRINIQKLVFEVLTAVTMKSTIFWHVAPCGPIEVHQDVILCT